MHSSSLLDPKRRDVTLSTSPKSSASPPPILPQWNVYGANSLAVNSDTVSKRESTDKPSRTLRYFVKRLDGLQKMVMWSERSVGLARLSLRMMWRRHLRDICLWQVPWGGLHWLRSCWLILFGIMMIGRRSHKYDAQRSWCKEVIEFWGLWEELYELACFVRWH